MSRARFFYTVLVWCVMPLAALYLLWRSRRQPDYRRHWSERFGWADYRRMAQTASVGRRGPLIWVHAVSVGETRAAEPLIAALAGRYADARFLLTHMTPTGRAAGAEVAARWPGRVAQCYLPYDLPFAVRRFLRAWQPSIGLGMETETWPNLLACARAAQLPMVLVNARLSEKSLRAALRTPALMREAATAFTAVLAQTEADAARMRQVGAERIEVIGNLKFDFAPDEALLERGRRWRQALGGRSLLLFASTREGEEALLLAALQRAGIFARDDTLALVVPRHPQRFDEVARAMAEHGAVVRRSAPAWDSGVLPPRALLLGDSMGEMAMYYAAADVACIGGSLLPLGGQNLIEACAVGTPVVVGPHTFNFEQASADAINLHAAQRVSDADAAVAAMLAIADDRERRARMSAAALAFAAQHRGATDRAVQRIAPIIEDRFNGSPLSRG